ncbi:kinase-like protein [Clavulina sp. PMI_390]|nr:kinase-like protein [Clavulina sp. PMI_390]
MVRPRTDALYDRLDNFFPEGILDEPVPDLIPSPTGNELSAVFPPISPTTATVHPRNDRSADEQEQPATGLSRSKQNRKSIRVVADEHRRNLKNLFSGSGKTAGGKAALGRRMTKLWGNRVEEMPPVPKLPHSHHHHQQDTWVRGRLIGKGSYGRVYYGLNATTGEVMAVKQVELPRTASDQIDKRQQNVISALRGESDTLSKLDHPNVVQYLGIEQTDDFLSIFLEYVSGGSIGFCTAKYGRFQEDIVKSFTKQISEGLAYLHESGILHRDLKGDNILIDPNGICKITDFGISRQADDIYAAATHTAMQGSICWMAPEVIQNPKRAEYSAKIDVWSLGCVVLEMWTGKRPWDGEWPVTVIYKLGTNREPPPVPENIRLNELADDFRRRCFAIDPDERPTAAELTTNPYLVLPSKWVFPGFPEPVGTDQSAGWTASMIQQP